MASFFQQIIDLGDESAAAADRQPLDEDIDQMPRDELRAAYRKVLARVQGKDTEIAQLQDDAAKLQSRFDAYKKKVDGWQQHMKELRAEDKKALEEFRAASAVGGAVGDTYVKSLEEKITALKQAASNAQEEISLAFRRQRDAEQGRAAVEASAKKDYDELFSRFTTYKEKSKSTQDRYESQINTLSEELSHLQSVTPVAASPVVTTTGEAESDLVKSLRNELAAALQGSVVGLGARSTPTGDSSYDAVATTTTTDDGAALDESPTGGGSSSTTGAASATLESPTTTAPLSPVTAGDTESKEALRRVQSTIGIHEATIEALRGDLVASKAKDASMSKRIQSLEAEIRTLQEEAEWKGVESDRTFSELRSTSESWRAKHTEVLTQLEERDARVAVLERHAERSLNDGEHSRKLEVDKYERLLELEHQKQAALQERVVEMGQRLSYNEDKVLAAGESADRAASDLKALQASHSVTLAEKDERISQLMTIVEIKGSAAAESKEEALRVMAQLESVRAELHSKDAAMRSVEYEQADVQRVLASREDDLHGRERERQSLRTRLQDEEDKCTELKGALRECELKVAELEAEGRRREQARSLAMEDNIRLAADKEHLEETLNHLQKQLTLKESQVSELGRRIQEQAQQGSAILNEGSGGERGGGGGSIHNTIVEQFEVQVARLERELRLAKEEVVNTKKMLQEATAAAADDIGGGEVASSSSGVGMMGSSGGNGGGTGGSGGGGADSFILNMIGATKSKVGATPFGRIPTMGNAFTNARRSVVVKDIISQVTWKTVIIGVLLMLTLTSMWSGSKAIGGVHSKDEDSLDILRDKYSQATIALQSCQSALKQEGSSGGGAERGVLPSPIPVAIAPHG